MRCPPKRPATRPLIAVAGCAAMLTAGCGARTDIGPDDIRTYSVRREIPRPTPPAVPADGEAATSQPRYEVPPGWQDRGASGMRLATLTIGDPADGHEVTLIEAAGTPRANVERWQRQLDAAADDAEVGAAVDRALAAAEKIDVDGAEATVVTLLDAAAAGDPDASGRAILAAIIPLDTDRSLFVKYMGDAAVARREREAFVRFVSSLRWK